MIHDSGTLEIQDFRESAAVVLKLELHGASDGPNLAGEPSERPGIGSFLVCNPSHTVVRHWRHPSDERFGDGRRARRLIGPRFGGSPPNVTIKSLVDSPSGTLQTRIT